MMLWTFRCPKCGIMRTIPATACDGNGTYFDLVPCGGHNCRASFSGRTHIYRGPDGHILSVDVEEVPFSCSPSSTSCPTETTSSGLSASLDPSLPTLAPMLVSSVPSTPSKSKMSQLLSRLFRAN